jgi:hypothetical protein
MDMVPLPRWRICWILENGEHVEHICSASSMGAALSIATGTPSPDGIRRKAYSAQLVDPLSPLPRIPKDFSLRP